MKFITKEWFKRLEEARKERDGEKLAWLEAQVAEARAHTAEMDIDGLLERAITSFSYEQEQVTLKTEGGALCVKGITLLETQLGLERMENALLKAVEIYRLEGKGYELGLLMEREGEYFDLTVLGASVEISEA